MKSLIYLVGLVLIFGTCQEVVVKKSPKLYDITEIPTPCKTGGEPNLFVSETGQIYLSWVEYHNDSIDALQFSILENDEWTAPKTIASGSDWFVNWADFPSLVAYKDGGQSLAAHWLQKSAAGTYDYDVRIAQSMDSGQNWLPSFIPHRDGIAAEHGFVSMLPLSKERIFATWLDGRNTKGESHGDKGHGHGHHGAMALRAAVFDKSGNLYEETELDARICDCCQTSAALTEKGIIVAYRDRTEDEIRDISVIRKVDGKWESPQLVFKDNWKIAGCPVNGPSINAQGKTVVIAWFSMTDGKPEVKVAFSNDCGATFSLPVKVDDSEPLGRVDILLLSKKQSLVSWLEKTDTGAAIKARQVSHDGTKGNSFLVAASTASRQSGFPVMTKSKEKVIFAWTDTDSIPRVKSAVMNVE